MAKRVLKRPLYQYNPQVLSQVPINELRKEYTRLRGIAQKRIKRLGESEFRGSRAYVQNVGRFKTLANIDKKGTNLIYSLIEVARFVGAKSSTVSGMRAIRRKTLHTLREGGWYFLNADNFSDFTDMLEYIRAVGLDKMHYVTTVNEYGIKARTSLKGSDYYEQMFKSWMMEGEEGVERFIRKSAEVG